MLRSGGMKFALSSSSTSGGGGRTQVGAGAGGDGAGRGGASLAQLEHVLQRLNKHDERTQIQRVERTSAQTQHKLLKDELMKAQEELALAHTGKSKLCEEIGALQQAKHDQQTQIEHLLVELRSSRESQAAMAKKVDELEQGTKDLKSQYTRSLTCRVKMASELLSKLEVAGAIGGDLELANTIQSKCQIWIGSEPNKRKRMEEERQPSIVEACAVDDDPMVGQPSNEKSPPTEMVREGECVADRKTLPETVDSATNSDDPEPTVSKENGVQCHSDCQSCTERALENVTLKDAAEKEIAAAKNALQSLEDRNCELLKAEEHARARMSALSQLLLEKEGTIEELKEALAIEKEKAMEAEKSLQNPVEAKANDAVDDSGARIKVLEDNLAQLNTYADHLEMLISQCASCSVKLQSENTQASEQ